MKKLVLPILLWAGIFMPNAKAQDCPGSSVNAEITVDFDTICKVETVTINAKHNAPLESISENWVYRGSNYNTPEINLSTFFKNHQVIYEATNTLGCTSRDTINFITEDHRFSPDFVNIFYGVEISGNLFALTRNSELHSNFTDRYGLPFKGINPTTGAINAAEMDYTNHTVYSETKRGCQDSITLIMNKPSFSSNYGDYPFGIYCNTSSSDLLKPNGKAEIYFISEDGDSTLLSDSIFDPKEFSAGNHQIGVMYNNVWNLQDIQIQTVNTDTAYIYYKGIIEDTINISVEELVDGPDIVSKYSFGGPTYIAGLKINDDDSGYWYYLDDVNSGINSLTSRAREDLGHCVHPGSAILNVSGAMIDTVDFSVCKSHDFWYKEIRTYPKGGIKEMINAAGEAFEFDDFLPADYDPGKYLMVYRIPGTDYADTVNVEILDDDLPYFFNDTVIVKNPDSIFNIKRNNYDGYLNSWLNTEVEDGFVKVLPTIYNTGYQSIRFTAYDGCTSDDTIVVKFETGEDCNFHINEFSNISTLRPGFTSSGYLKFYNSGLEYVNSISCTFKYDTLTKVFDTKLAGGSIIENDTVNKILYFKLDPSFPTEESILRFDIKTEVGEWHLGKIANFEVEMTYSCIDSIQYSETLNIEETIRGSYDPNHKEALQGDGAIDPETEWLTYEIQFQNTGSDTAFNIVVEDTLDPLMFDINTVEMLNASHAYEFTKDVANNLLSWKFPNILLVDSNTNEPLSHGSFFFKVKLKEGIEENEMIKNKAFIYFDFNSPIITNEAYNFFKGPESSIYIDEKVNWISYQVGNNILISGASDKSNFSLMDISGRIVANSSNSINEYSFNISNLTPGTYVIREEVSNTSQLFIIK